MHATDSDLSMILGPIGRSEFFDEYWEQNPLHVSRSDAEHFASLLSLQTIETLLSSQALFYPSTQLVRLHDPVAESSYTDKNGRIIPQRLLEYHHAGATIVLSQAHDRLPALADFRRSVQKAIQLRCQANVYLSPPGKQGFNAHYDSHDVFILQVAGCKTFNFYAGGTELPYAHDGFEAARHRCGELQASVFLEAGDTLYIPRGVMHDAVASERSSLHITLGVHAITLRDVMLEMVQQLTQEDARYRKSLPGSWLLPEQTHALMGELLADKLSPAYDLPQLKQALSNLADSAALDSAADCHGMLTASSGHVVGKSSLRAAPVDELGLSDCIRFRHSQLLSHERSGSRLRCRTHGQVLEFSDSSALAVEYLMKVDRCEVSALSSLDDEQKIAICQRLLYANLLHLADA